MNNSRNSKKVLIIGAKGMLGQVLVKAFQEDFDVTAWDREDIDITQKQELKKKIKELKPNIIVNSAAYNDVDACEKKEGFDLAKKINAEAPGNLAEIAKEVGAILVHYSSDYVFSGEPVIPEPSGCTHNCASCSLHEGFTPEIGFKEDDEPAPISKYGKSKLLGEQEIQKKGEKYYIIRLSKLFGAPAKTRGAKKSFFDVMLELGRKEKEVKGVDEETSCFTYAPDLAKKTKEIIESQKPFGIYHVTNSEPCTWYEAILELYKQAGIKTKVILVTGEEFPRRAKRPFYSVLINTKLNPMRSYKEALKEYLKTTNTQT